jgi:arginase
LNVDILVVPYDSGLRLERMGQGPACLLDRGLVRALEGDGHRVAVSTLETRCSFRVEAGVAVDLQRQVSDAVRAARSRGVLPLVLSGNCNMAVGTLAALGSETGAVWFDAHGDMNTPDTSPSGYFDGMALAMATGRCWRTLAASVPGWSALPDRDVVLVGARDLDPGERELLAASHVCWVRADSFRAGDLGPFEAALTTLRSRVGRVYLHLDLDVHDPLEAPANTYPAADGLSRAQVLDAAGRVGARFEIAAAGFAAYDPSVDPQGRTADAAIELARAITRARGSAAASARAATAPR